MNAEITNKIFETATVIGIGSFGCGVKYIYDTVKGRVFKLGQFIGYLIVGGFVGYVADQLLPVDRGSRGAIIGVISFLSFQVLEFLDNNGIKILVNRLLTKDDLEDIGTENKRNIEDLDKKEERGKEDVGIQRRRDLKKEEDI